MPHIRKPNKVNSQSSNIEGTKVADGDIKSKVDQSKRSILSPDESESSKRDESASEKCDTVDPGLKSVSDNKKEKSDKAPYVASVVSSGEVPKKKSEGCAKNVPKLVTDKVSVSKSEVKCSRNSVESSTTLFVTSVENYPVKDKKVKFAEGSLTKHSDSGSGYRKPYHGSKSDKQKSSFYPNFKTENKNILPLPQPAELFVPQVGEIAVITDLVPDDPISACLPCLEANGTYICTPCNPRCFIIQKVRPFF